MAGSTHEGEDEILLEAFGRISSGSRPLRGAKLAIAPRHPERSGSIASMADKFGKTALYSELPPAGEADIIVVDVIGVLFELYGLAEAAFIGGSMVPRGGQNILEPAIWGVPVLHGPHMEDFAEHTAELDSTGAAYRVSTPGDIEGLWRDAASGRLPNCCEAVSKFFSEKSGASARAWKYFEKYL